MGTLYKQLTGSFTDEIRKGNVPRTFSSLTPATFPAWIAQVGPDVFSQLVSPLQSYSMTSLSTSYVWAQSLKNPTTAQFLASRWGVSAELQQTMAAWYINYTTTHIEETITSLYGVPSASLGVLQYSSLGVLKGSLYQYGNPPTLNYYPELAGFLTFVKSPPQPNLFTLQQAQEIFTGNGKHKGFTDPSTVGTFLMILVQTDPAAVAKSLNDVFGWSVEQGLAFYSYFQYILANTIELPIKSGNGGLYARQTVKDFTFSYNDPLVAILSPETNPIRVTTNHSSLEEAQKDLPQSEWTGKENPNLVMNYITWKAANNVSGWLTPEPIGGGDASSFPPKLSKDNHPEFSVFSKTLQRQIQISYVTDTSVKDIDMLEYTLKPGDLASAEKNPRNARFYAGIDGMHNMTAVEIVKGAQGIPVFASKPHMMDVNSSISNLVQMKGNTRPGMNPDPSKHSSFIRIEPTTGKTMDVALRLQVNIQLKPENFGVYFKPPRSYVLPVYWIDERSTVTDKLASDFRSAIQSPRKLSKTLQILGVVGGVFGLILGLVLLALGVKQLRARESFGGPNPTSQ
eukprot:TRINITY_DN728_c0_g1_i2.p1 TRINITY_DN728_c0_g1~~TRINITY_DN728_c0_g1_i2.p1  ORF type:complete len:569 (+),score=178.61 TRINITY_DN728_c0_g1_i2:603-2309(+)